MNTEENKEADSPFSENEEKEMFNPSIVNEDSYYHDLIKMLSFFEDLDKISTNFTKELKDKIKIKKQIEKKLPLNMLHHNSNLSPKKVLLKSRKDNELRKISDKTILFILNMSLEEIHQSFKEFYSQFDKNNDLYVSREEFFSIIKYLMKMPSINEEKMVLLTKYILKEAFNPQSSNNKGTKITDIEAEKKFTNDLFERLFFKMKKRVINNESGFTEYMIEFLTIFPFMLSFYLENCKCKIKAREDNIQIIKGTSKQEEQEDIENKMMRDQNSLIYRFELKGFSFKHFKNSKDITYREIEEIVIRFKNSYTKSIDDVQLNYVLKDLQQLLEVNPHSKLAKKKKTMKKILHWLSYKICTTCSLFSIKKQNAENEIKPYKFVEENILWSIAAYGYRYSHKLGSKFRHYLEKLNKIVTLDNYENILFNFFKKIITHLTHDRFLLIIKNYNLKTKILSEYHSKDDNVGFILADHIQNIVYFETQTKLKKYLNSIILKVSDIIRRNTKPSSPLKREIDRMKSATSNRKSQSPLISPQRAFSLTPDKNIIFEKDEIVESKEKQMNLSEEKLLSDFHFKAEEEKKIKFSKALQLLNNLYKNKKQKNDPSYYEVKSVKTINMNSSIQNSDNSFNDNESEKGSRAPRSDSEDNEERKSVRIQSRNIQTSINLNVEPTKASVFRKNKNLSVKTMVSANMLTSVHLINPENEEKKGRIIKKTTTLINNDSPLQFSPVKKKISQKEFTNLFKKNSVVEKLQSLRKKKKSVMPQTFLKTSFLEKEVQDVRQYHRVGVEINYPDLLKDKNIMSKSFSNNNISLSRNTTFSKRLQEKMKRQIQNHEENEKELSENEKSWLRCDFNSKNSCRCLIY